MLLHPWIEIQDIIREKWLTQKAFSILLGKKVSEVNELLKGKRNITIQRDYALHKALWTPIKYRILKQVDYDYSLLEIWKEPDLSPINTDSNQESITTNTNETTSTEPDLSAINIEEIQTNIQPNNNIEVSEDTTQEPQENSEDSEFYKRADIFRDF